MAGIPAARWNDLTLEADLQAYELLRTPADLKTLRDDRESGIDGFMKIHFGA